MLQEPTKRKVKTLFAAYFKQQVLTDLTKKLSVRLPAVRYLPKLYFEYHFSPPAFIEKLSGMLKMKYFSNQSRTPYYDLDQLHEKIAFRLELTEPGLEKWFRENPEIKLDAFDVKKVLETQSDLLNTLIKEQRIVLRKEIDTLYEDEIQNIKTKKKNA